MDFVLNFLERRCIAPNRPDIDEILSSMNLKEYNVLDILKKTHGVDFDDFTWIRFDGEKLTWNDVKARG